MTIEILKNKLKIFASERDWDQFHTPKNLAMALSVEVSELLELFQWLTEKQSYNLSSETKERAEQEIGDILIYLIRISDKLNIDPIEAAEKKIQLNTKKYPVNKAKGNAKKYYDL